MNPVTKKNASFNSSLRDDALRKNSWLILLSVMSMLATAVVFYLLNRWQPFVSDDFLFGYGIDKNGLALESRGMIASFADLVESRWNHWHVANGRIIAGTIIELFRIHDKALFDVANTMALLALAGCIVRLFAERKLPGKWVAAAGVLGLRVLCMPDPHLALVWMTGSCNYLWILLLASLFLLLFTSESVLARMLSLLLAIPVGNSHEGVSIGIVTFLMLYLCLNFRKGRTPVICAALLLAGVGLALNLCSPGLHARMSYSPIGAVDFGSFGVIYALLVKIVHSMIWGASLMLKHHVAGAYLPSLVFMGISVWMLWKQRKKLRERRQVWALSCLAGGILQACAVMVTGYMGPCTWVGVFFFMLLSAFVYIVPALQKACLSWQFLVWALFAGGGVAALASSVPGAQQNQRLAAHIQERALAGESVIDVSEHCTPALESLRYGASVLGSNGLSADCFYYCNWYAANWFGSSPFSLLTRKNLEELEMPSAEMMEKARAGWVYLLPNGDVFLALPIKPKMCNAWPFQHGMDAQGKPYRRPCATRMAWRFDDCYGIIITPSAEYDWLSVKVRTVGEPYREYEVSSAETEQLKKEGSCLPAAFADR